MGEVVEDELLEDDALEEAALQGCSGCCCETTAGRRGCGDGEPSLLVVARVVVLLKVGARERVVRGPAPRLLWKEGVCAKENVGAGCRTCMMMLTKRSPPPCDKTRADVWWS